jgi:acetoin utilization deacetylase AcuC-like enzyme
MLILSSPRFQEHVTPPGHPERLERGEVLDAVARDWRNRGVPVVEPRPATRADLARVHVEAHIDRIAATAGKPAMLDPDTFTSPESYEVSLLAAGATLAAAEHALRTGETAFAFVRPPGHHAEADKAMGFCLFNNVAVAAAAALAGGADKVAIVDIDVHHGNGTQWIFYDDPRVLYISSHQFPFYPGTGAAGETGGRHAPGFTVNIPLEAGATDADYALVYRSIVGPVLEEFAPRLTIVSAGYDAHEADPLASMRMSAAGYFYLLGSLKASATRSGPLALATEGGYDLAALRECLDASLAVLDGSTPTETGEHILSAGPARRGERALAAVRQAQSPFWRGL